MTTDIRLVRSGDDRQFDGIGAVNGGGATSALLKDYPEPQRSQILDMVFRPKFGASVSTMLAEIPGDGNATQGSMPSHMHSRDDLNGASGYTWWVLSEAKRRNPRLSLDAAAWSAPGWVGDGQFWSADAVDYYIAWLQILRHQYELELDAIGCRNEKGVSLEFAKLLRRALDDNGFGDVRLHAFDNWPSDKFDFVEDLVADEQARDSIDIIGAHVMYGKPDAHAPARVQDLADVWGKPIWNTEDHVYKSGFDCLIGIVECFNDNFIHSRATKTVLWYDIAGVYPVEPYAVDPAMLIAHEPWSGHYVVREALWGYAHYGQFTELGWSYISRACKALKGDGSVVALAGDGGEYSLIIETKDATAPQFISVAIEGFSDANLSVWRSTSDEQFVEVEAPTVSEGAFEMELLPNAVYSITTTRGQQKGSFDKIPSSRPFPFPYRETLDSYHRPEAHGFLPRYTADIAGSFEVVPTSGGMQLQQTVPVPTISWAPDWHPYTIFGSLEWDDIEVTATITLEGSDAGGVMARVHHVGTGYGFIPKGYVFDLAADGSWRLLSINGKANKRELVGDAEQQAIIRASNDEDPGGERVLASGRARIAPGQQDMMLRCDGIMISAYLNGSQLASVADSSHVRGMGGLIALATSDAVSRPAFNEYSVRAVRADAPRAATPPDGWRAIYERAEELAG